MVDRKFTIGFLNLMPDDHYPFPLAPRVWQDPALRTYGLTQDIEEVQPDIFVWCGVTYPLEVQSMWQDQLSGYDSLCASPITTNDEIDSFSGNSGPIVVFFKRQRFRVVRTHTENLLECHPSSDFDSGFSFFILFYCMYTGRRFLLCSFYATGIMQTHQARVFDTLVRALREFDDTDCTIVCGELGRDYTQSDFHLILSSSFTDSIQEGIGKHPYTYWAREELDPAVPENSGEDYPDVKQARVVFYHHTHGHALNPSSLEVLSVSEPPDAKKCVTPARFPSRQHPNAHFPQYVTYEFTD